MGTQMMSLLRTMTHSQAFLEGDLLQLPSLIASDSDVLLFKKDSEVFPLSGFDPRIFGGLYIIHHSETEQTIVYEWINHAHSWTFSKEDSLASIIYYYKHGFSGFAAMLTKEQAKQLAGQIILSGIEIGSNNRFQSVTNFSWSDLNSMNIQ